MKKLFKVFMAVITVLSMIITISVNVIATTGPLVTPTPGSGNVNNATEVAALGFPTSTYHISNKIDGDNLTVGTHIYTDGIYTTQYTITDINNDGKGEYISFTATVVSIAGVVVGGGNNHNTYTYDPPNPVPFDSGLHAPENNGGNIPNISHFFFVWKIPTGSPSLPELPALALLALGLVGVGGFILYRRRTQSSRS
jgi:hypothetical protein